MSLEAGKHLSIGDFVNDPGVMDAKLGWHDPRKGAPLWLCKTVGGTSVRWAGITPRFQANHVNTLLRQFVRNGASAGAGTDHYNHG